MKKVLRQVVALAVGLGSGGFLVGATAAEKPQAASPGSPAQLQKVADACPTFSWGGVEHSRAYELVVYRLDAQSEETRPVLRRTLAGSIQSWTPSLDACLERGARYAWTVRALGRDETSDWAAFSLFEVSAGPSEADFEAALDVVRRYLATEGSAGVAESSESDRDGEAPGTDKTPVIDSQISLAPSPLLNVAGGAAATYFVGDGSSLTDLDGDSLTSGTVAEPRIAAEITRDSEVAGIVGPHTVDTTCLDAGVACNFAASATEGGAAMSGDSATGFFSTGQIEEPRIADALTRDAEILPRSWFWLGTPPFAFDEESNNTAGTAQTVGASQPIEGTISPAGDQDWFATHEARVGDLVFAFANAIGSAASTDSVLYAYAADGTTLIGTDDDNGPGLSSVIAGVEVPQTAKVLFQVIEFLNNEEILPFELFHRLVDPADVAAEQENNDTFAAATPITAAMMEGSMNGDTDWFWFFAPAGARLVVMLDQDADGDAINAAMTVSLIAPDGSTTLASNTQSGPNNGAGPVTATSSGKHFVRLSGSNSSEPYRFVLQLRQR